MKQMTIMALALGVACASPERAPEGSAGDSTAAGDNPGMGATDFPADPAEPYLRNLKMLTHGGENAEAYFSPDGQQLIFQSTNPPVSECDQIFVMNIDGTNLRRVSTGQGRTTCGYFLSRDRIVYASTHEHSPACPPPPDRSRGYVWALYEYDIYSAALDGSDLKRLTNTPGYDAEATVSPDGQTIVFTSVRDGDLEIYTMDVNGGNVRRLTHEPGYDGGAFFSPDGAKIVYRASHPADSAALADYRSLLADGLVRPTRLSLWIMDADGSNRRQITENVAADFAPYMHPDGRRIIFSSNRADPQGRNFDIYMINIDGTGLEQITVHPEFDGFPMFNADGTKLVFASNRGASRPGETNVFIADWVETTTR